MATRPRSLFLYLTLVCFFGLITIFVADGYMGVYDTIYATTGEREQKIESDVWLRQDSYWSPGINRDEKAFFRYEVANRQFSTYTNDVEVSVWRMQEKVLDVLSQPLTVNPFAEEQVEWTVDSAEILPADTPPEQRYEYTVLIKMGEIERRLIMNINPVPYEIKPPTPVTSR